MRIPQKTEYACRVLVQLAGARGELCRVDDLAEKEAVSSSYLLQILNDLRHAGLVESRRGKNGGYLLSRVSDQITVHDVVEAVEGAALETSGDPKGASGDAVARAWQEISKEYTKVLSLWTIERIRSEGDDVGSYMI